MIRRILYLFTVIVLLQTLPSKALDPFGDINTMDRQFEGNNLSSHLVVKFATDKDILFVLKGMSVSRPALIESEHWNILGLWFEDSTNLSLDSLIESHENPSGLAATLEKEFGSQRMNRPDEINSTLEKVKTFFRQVSSLKVLRNAYAQEAMREVETILAKSAFVIKKSLLRSIDLLEGNPKTNPGLKKFLEEVDLTRTELSSLLEYAKSSNIKGLARNLGNLFSADLLDPEALVQNLEEFQDKLDSGLTKFKK